MKVSLLKNTLLSDPLKKQISKESFPFINDHLGSMEMWGETNYICLHRT